MNGHGTGNTHPTPPYPRNQPIGVPKAGDGIPCSGTTHAAETNVRDVTVSKVAEGVTWPYSLGQINEEMFNEHLFTSGPDTISTMCGPPGMVNYACLPNFKKMGYTDHQCIVF